MMAIPIYLTLPASRCLRCVAQRKHGIFTNRSFATTASKLDEGLQSSISPQVTLDPVLVSTHKQEKKPAKTRPRQIGSERRRAAIKSTGSIPFEQLPYQCFQEARKILQADREDKIKQIEVERKRIANAEAQDVASWGGEASKKGRLIAMHKHLEHLKILADINDPVIKKRFEDDKGRCALHPTHSRPLKSVLITLRRHESSYISLPRRSPMALLQTPPHHATDHANAYCPGHCPLSRSRC